MKKTILTSLSLILVSSSLLASDPLSSEKSGAADPCETGTPVTEADKVQVNQDSGDKADLLNVEAPASTR